MKYDIRDDLIIFDDIVVEYVKSQTSIDLGIDRNERIGKIVVLLGTADDRTLQEIHNYLLRART